MNQELIRIWQTDGASWIMIPRNAKVGDIVEWLDTDYKLVELSEDNESLRAKKLRKRIPKTT